MSAEDGCRAGGQVRNETNSHDARLSMVIGLSAQVRPLHAAELVTVSGVGGSLAVCTPVCGGRGCCARPGRRSCAGPRRPPRPGRPSPMSIWPLLHGPDRLAIRRDRRLRRLDANQPIGTEPGSPPCRSPLRTPICATPPPDPGSPSGTDRCQGEPAGENGIGRGPRARTPRLDR